MRLLAIFPLLALGACAATGGPYPSLQPRAAEAIDPRLPVVRPLNDRPVTRSLAEQLAALVDKARSGDAAFNAAASDAERLSASAGAPQGEAWIAAQQAVTAAIAARGPVAKALGDVDALAAEALQRQGGLAPNDLAAIEQAQSEVGAIDARQAARLAAIQKKLGL